MWCFLQLWALPILCLNSTTNILQSKLVVLKSLSAFLRQAISSADSPSGSSSSVMPTWYMASSFSTPAAYVAFDCTLQASSSSAFTHKPWKLECTFYEETFVGRYPLVQDSNELAFSFQDLSDFSHATLDSKNSSAADRSNIAYISVRPTNPHELRFLTCWAASFSHAPFDSSGHVPWLCSRSFLSRFQPSRDGTSVGHGTCRDLPHSL